MYKDLTGQRFGKLVVLEEAGACKYKGKIIDHYWKCQCDCGNIAYVRGNPLRAGKTKSCGCIRSFKSAERLKENRYNHFEDLTGRRFGKLTVIKRAESRKGRTYWLCECDCGNFKEIDAARLKYGKTKSCGCLRRKKHEI